MNLQAVEWYTANMGQARWDQYSPEEQGQLITTYYTLGPKTMTDSAAAQIALTGNYTPHLDSDGGRYVGSGSNVGVTDAALGQNGSIVTLPDGTTRYLDGNGRIIREDSPTTDLDPSMGSLQNNLTIKEYDQNNSVIRQTTKTSNADDSQSELVGWVEPFAKPITPNTIIDGYRGVYHRAGRRPGPLARPILCTTRKQAA